MKKFNLFGLKFMFEIKRSDRNDAEIYSSSYSLREKILYLILVMFVIAFSSKISLLSRNNNYKVGDVVISDIYAPKTIVFRDQSAKEKIVEEMIVKSGKEYIYSADAGRIYLETFDDFFNDVYSMKEKEHNEVDFKSLEKNTGRKISENMIQEILRLDVKDIKNYKRKQEVFLKDFMRMELYRKNQLLSTILLMMRK